MSKLVRLVLAFEAPHDYEEREIVKDFGQVIRSRLTNIGAYKLLPGVGGVDIVPAPTGDLRRDALELWFKSDGTPRSVMAVEDAPPSSRVPK